MQGEDAPSLLTRSIRHDTGEAYWLLTKATLTHEADGARLAINIIEDVTDAKDAELRQRFLAEAGQLLASSLDYEQTLERVARMIVPAARRLVRDRHGRREGRHGERRGRPRRPGEGPDGARDARALPAGSRRADRRAGDPARRPAELYREIPDELLEAARGRRGAPARHPRGRLPLGDGRADADRQRDARRDHVRLRRERPRVRRGRPGVRRGPRAARRDRRPERPAVHGAGAGRPHAAGEPAARPPARGPGLGDARGLPGRRARRRRRRRLLRRDLRSTPATWSCSAT